MLFFNTYRVTNFGSEQYEWIFKEIQHAAHSLDIDGVVLMKSYPWYSPREWNVNTTFYQKLALAEYIQNLGFNTPKLNKFLVMISGDMHAMTYDSGFLNEHGKFPIFQCSSIDSTPSCKSGGFSSSIFMNRD